MAESAGATGATRRERLAQRRKTLGLTQEDLAELLGVERSTVVRWECGETEPGPWVRPKLAKALKVSADRLGELLDGGGPGSEGGGRYGAAAAAVPRQLPTAVVGFAGRAAELAGMRRCYRSARRGRAGCRPSSRAAGAGAAGIEFGLLGPLTVRAGGVPVPIARGKQRALLAALLLNAGQVVSLDRLQDALWDACPRTARVTIQNYVRRLRTALGDHDLTRIATHPGGYSIRIAPGELDLARFTAHLAASRTAARDRAWQTAAAEACAALALWRGDPLADVDSAPLARSYAPMLAELRPRALQARIDAELHLGYGGELIAELRHLTAASPLSEHPRAQLMLALYRDGRQAEALAVYTATRELLVSKLGQEPGPELRDLHQRILTADPALIIPAPRR